MNKRGPGSLNLRRLVSSRYLFRECKKGPEEEGPTSFVPEPLVLSGPSPRKRGNDASVQGAVNRGFQTVVRDCQLSRG